MATTTDKRLCAGALSDSNATLYTAPSGVGDYVIIKAVTLCNTTAGAVAATLKFNGIAVVSTFPVLAYDTITIPFIDQIIEASEVIEGSCGTASAINYYISGKEIVA